MLSRLRRRPHHSVSAADPTPRLCRRIRRTGCRAGGTGTGNASHAAWHPSQRPCRPLRPLSADRSATNVTYELQGPGLDDLVGASVEVTGSIFDAAPAEGASRVISVSDIHQMPLSEMPEQLRDPPGGRSSFTNHCGGAPPTPSGETVPRMARAPRSAPLQKLPPPRSQPPPLLVRASPQHSDTAKIVIIVASPPEQSSGWLWAGRRQVLDGQP